MPKKTLKRTALQSLLSQAKKPKKETPDLVINDPKCQVNAQLSLSSDGVNLIVRVTGMRKYVSSSTLLSSEGIEKVLPGVGIIDAAVRVFASFRGYVRKAQIGTKKSTGI